MKERSRSTIQSIKSEFQLKFKDKISFVNKQGIICSVFESATQSTQLKSNSPKLKNSHSSLTLKSQKIISVEKKQHKTFDVKNQRLFSLPKLRSSLSTYVEQTSRKGLNQKKNFNAFILGLSSGGENLKRKK